MTTLLKSAEPAMNYRCIRAGYGYYTFEVDSYEVFIREIAPLFVDCYLPTGPSRENEKQNFVWRGMRDPSWSLQSSLSRFASENIKSDEHSWRQRVSDMTTRHLMQFLNEARGLGFLTRLHDGLYGHLQLHEGAGHLSFYTVLRTMNEEQRHLTHELFSLGQHHALLTPFLDWTRIPLIALYFAFAERDERSDGVGDRVVFALNKTAVERICPPREVTADDIIFIESMAHDNPRIVSQSGVFSFVPAHVPVDEWVVSDYVNNKTTKPSPEIPILIRFLIRNRGRSWCLEELASAGIHARNVFPDRFGAALHTNFGSESSTKSGRQ